MMTQTIPPVPAAELAVGDRIAEGFLPTGEPAIVLFLDHYSHGGRLWVFVVYRFADGEPYANSFPADRPFPLESRADTGLAYSREPESTVVSPVPAGVEGHPEGTRAAVTPAEHWPGTPLVHRATAVTGRTECGLPVLPGERTSLLWEVVTCKACIDKAPF